jgi:hypothetical protein
MSSKYIVDGKKINLMDENWDILIILDACRYDYFKKVYKKYIKKGTLKKAISPAKHTMEWLAKIFIEYYDDIVYISATPRVNSKLEIEELGFKFDGKKHFFKIIDVWDFGWNENLGTIPPENVTKTFLKIMKKYKEKRFILHYKQPHAPYIGKKYRKYISKKHMERVDKILEDIGNFKKFAEKIILKIFGISIGWRILNFLYKGPTSQTCAIYLKEGWKGVREAYKENLEFVLKNLKEIIDNFKGNILITSDHGEFLGEYRCYGHLEMMRKPENIEVPWLKIDGEKKSKIKFTEKDRLIKRISELKIKNKI